MSEKMKVILSRNGMSAFTVLLFVSIGWMTRGWLEAQADSWDSLQYTLQRVVPVLAFLLWVSFDETFIKSGFIRIALNGILLVGLIWWQAGLSSPVGYSVLGGVPVLLALLVGLLLGITVLAVLKPHLASWPWWK